VQNYLSLSVEGRGGRGRDNSACASIRQEERDKLERGKKKRLSAISLGPPEKK
jgi:hypothetical protein